MALINYADRVKDTTTTTGTGSVTLSGTAPTGFQSFDTAFGHAGNYFSYCIAAGSEWEVGEGHLSASTTLVRDTVYASSNSGSLVSFSAGTKDVFCTIAAGGLPQSSIHRLATTVVDTNSGANQTLYTVPTGKTAIVTMVVLRNATANLATYANGFALGFVGGAYTEWSGDDAFYITQLLISSSVVVVCDVANQLADSGTLTKFVAGSAGSTFKLTFYDTGVAGSVTVDVFGYYI